MKKNMLSQDKFNEISQSLELKTLSLDSINASKNIEYISPQLGLNMSSTSKVEQEENILNFLYKFRLKEKSESKDKPGIEIKIVYRLEFLIKKKIEIPQEFYKLFQDLYIRIIVWPYVRELIQNTIVRMNMPPLTLPIMHGRKPQK